MNKVKTFKLNTEKEKLIADKILHELVVLAHFTDSFSKGREKLKKKWIEGVVFGMKYSIIHIVRKIDDPEKRKAYEKLVEWEKEEALLFDKSGYKKMQKLQKEKHK